jgi:hypothetical protein
MDAFTLPQVAQLFRSCYRQAYELLLTGAIDGRKVAGRWEIDAESVHDLAARRGVTFTDD